ncbi:MAG: hypothetical protein GY739_21765 [Mesoflavibacter sp.]|nr:hypothetical protein [Mesoflavibacter sp.]
MDEKKFRKSLMNKKNHIEKKLELNEDQKANLTGIFNTFADLSYAQPIFEKQLKGIKLDNYDAVLAQMEYCIALNEQYQLVEPDIEPVPQLNINELESKKTDDEPAKHIQADNVSHTQETRNTYETILKSKQRYIDSTKTIRIDKGLFVRLSADLKGMSKRKFIELCIENYLDPERRTKLMIALYG